MGSLPWHSAGTPTKAEFSWRGLVYEQVVPDWTPVDKGLSTVGIQKPAQHPWALPACHKGSFLGLSSLHFLPSLSLTVSQREKGEGVSSHSSSWTLWIGLHAERLKDTKLQAQALFRAWSLVDSQLQWVPGERRVAWLLTQGHSLYTWSLFAQQPSGQTHECSCLPVFIALRLEAGSG